MIGREQPVSENRFAGEYEEVRMHSRFRMSVGILAIVIAVLLLTRVHLVSQSLSPAKASTSAKAWSPPRTRDGHPDLQGIWNAATITPLERPAVFAGKLVVSEAEAAASPKNSSQLPVSIGATAAQKPTAAGRTLTILLTGELSSRASITPFERR